MKRDIKTTSDIDLVIRSFYHKALNDKLLKPIFDKSNIDLEKHLPRMFSFWYAVVLDINNYSGTPLDLHVQLNKIAPLNPEHFNQWLSIFNETVDDLYTGHNANKMKERAFSIGVVIQTKLQPKDPKV